MIKKFLINVGRYLLFLKMVFRKPEKWKIFWRQFINEADKLILSSDGTLNPQLVGGAEDGEL